ncbi:MAG: hypothetical protein PUB07_06050 [Clostridia bacterium]|nr:hypothetical protein [Clostridia bacterium]
MHTKKVFVLKNFKSPYIEQAIFILREDTAPNAPLSDAVAEAERIVEGFLENKQGRQQQEKHRFFHWTAVLGSLLIAVGLILFICKGFFS